MIRRSVVFAEYAHLPITEVRHERANRSIDREIGPVDAQTGNLSVRIGEVPASKKRVVGKVHAWNDMLCTKSDLFYFSKEIDGIAIERQSPNLLNRYEFLRNKLNESFSKGD